MKNCRLIYRSDCTDKLIANEDLRDILQQSAQRNREAGITGLLVLSGDQFLQVLEGPSDAVNTLYSKLISDTRHHDLKLISYELIAERYFDDWGMSLVDLYDLPKAERDILRRKYASNKDAVAFPERLHEVYAFLLDAKALCSGRPWEE